MNKKGFTLIELLGVIILISILGLFVIPNVINRFSNKKDDVSRVKKELVATAAKLYIGEHEDQYSKQRNEFSCLDINVLVKAGYLDKNVYDDNSIKSKKVKITYNDGYVYNLVDECKSEYVVGDKIKVADEYYYVVANSNSEDDYVVALKENPLTRDEVNLYGGYGTENNHVNKYTNYPTGSAYDHGVSKGHVAGIAFYSSETCGYVNRYLINSGCKNDYNVSDVKYVIDNWMESKFKNDELKEVTLTGQGNYKARIATLQELLPIGWPSCNTDPTYCSKESLTPSWIYNSGYNYWTMNGYINNYDMYYVTYDGKIIYASGYSSSGYVFENYNTVRPVINVYKAVIE